MTIMNDETALMLKGEGLDHCVVYRHSDDDYVYAIEVEWDGVIDEVIKCNGMFSFDLMAEKVFKHCSRSVERGDADTIRVTVRNADNGILWDKTREG